MKRIISALICVSMLFAVSLPFSAYTKYDEQTALLPFWEGDTVYDESVCVLQNQDGTFSPISLQYEIDEIISVRSSTLMTTYIEGKDYSVEDGKLVILDGSKIPFFKYREYYPIIPTGLEFPRTGGGYIFFSEGRYFHDKQVVITYKHSDSWQGYVPEKQLGALPLTRQNLENKSSLNVLFYGDSIFVGANSSSFISAKPYLKTWTELTVNALEKKYSISISSDNTSVGGTTSEWGAENTYLKAAIYEPDLAFIGFGMNDGDRDPAEYKENIEKIISTIRIEKPECEIVLVSSMLPNSEVNGAILRQDEYIYELRKIAAEQDGVIVADMTDLHSYILQTKTFRDMTGNNVNHPNDFLARLYAQLAVQTLTLSDMKGDCDIDGFLTSADARTCMMNAISSEKASGQEILNSDIDGDGSVTTTDVRKILQMLVD